MADLAERFEALGRDWAAFGELIELFLEHAPPLLVQLRAAVAMGDDWRTGKIAHRLLGSVNQFSEGEAGAALAHLEHMACACDFRGASEELERLESALTSLIRAMHPYRVALKRDKGSG